MRRTVIIVPDWASQPDSVLRDNLPALHRMAEVGEVFRLAPTPELETPEAAYLGLGYSEGQMRQGPLTVAALGADPPERSTHFHLSLMSLVDGVLHPVDVDLLEDELSVVMDCAARLNTKTLTVVRGEGVDNGLVWEDLGDLRDVPPIAAAGQQMKSSLPEGDGEAKLRRFIDDGVNLLSDLELNERRTDEGLSPLNLLWPWGHGVRQSTPNLVLRRGEPAWVVGGSLRLSGLARLCAYRPTDRSRFGRGLNTRLELIVSTALGSMPTVALIEAMSEFRSKSMAEEAHWLTREINARLVEPLVDDVDRGPSRLTILAPGDAGGIGVCVATGTSGSGGYPFDERLLDEAKVPAVDLSTAVERALLLSN